MKRVAIAALLIAAIVAVACVWHDKSASVSEGTGGNPEHRQAAVAVAASPSASPRPSPSSQIEYVIDSANVMDQSSRKQLETTLATFKERKKIDFAVVTVGSTGNQSARDYSLDLARERNQRVHDEHDNGGVLLLIAVNDRHWHVQVSHNLEDKLTNEVLTTLSQPMTGFFRQKHYSEGIVNYVNAIINKVAELQ